MTSKYDTYWQDQLDAILPLFDQARAAGKSSPLPLTGLDALGARGSWYGKLEIVAGQSVYDSAAHLAAFGPEVRQAARIYVWPLELRPRAADGRHGSLHAKVAIADGRVMLVSSANLTEYAMTLNMELGVMVNGGPVPERVAEHLGRLVELGTFRKVGSAVE